MLKWNILILCIVYVFHSCYSFIFPAEYGYGLFNGKCEDKDVGTKKNEHAFAGDILNRPLEMNEVVSEFQSNDEYIGRTADYASLSPTIERVGCIKYDDLTTQSDSIIKASIRYFKNVNSMSACNLDCINDEQGHNFGRTEAVFGYSNMTCYCFDNLNDTDILSDNLCDNSVRHVGVFIEHDYVIHEKMDHYNGYMVLCQYVTMIAHVVTLVFADCDIPVDGAICDMKATATLTSCIDNSNYEIDKQCVMQDTTENITEAKLTCKANSGVLTLNPDLNGLRSVLERYPHDKIYAVNGLREIFIFKYNVEGLSCVALLHIGRRLYIVTEDCRIKRQNVCSWTDNKTTYHVLFLTLTPLGLVFVVLMVILVRYETNNTNETESDNGNKSDENGSNITKTYNFDGGAVPGTMPSMSDRGSDDEIHNEVPGKIIDEDGNEVSNAEL
ncbi:hypothetical protein ACF0H5_010650 [Mactra antiquata]